MQQDVIHHNIALDMCKDNESINKIYGIGGAGVTIALPAND